MCDLCTPCVLYVLGRKLSLVRVEGCMLDVFFICTDQSLGAYIRVTWLYHVMPPKYRAAYTPYDSYATMSNDQL